METIALPNEDGSVFVASTTETDTRAVSAAYDMWREATRVAVEGDVEMFNKRTDRRAVVRYRWARTIDPSVRPAISDGSPVCYEYETSMLVVQVEQELDPGAVGVYSLSWEVYLHPSADINMDGKVDSGDQGLLFADWGKDAPRSDMNRDGVVDGRDLGLLQSLWGWKAPWNEQPAEETP